MTRTTQRQHRTRIKLLSAGYDRMSQVGVDTTTIQEITDRADVGFGTFYNYFESKHALAAEVLDCVIDNLGKRNDLVTQDLHESDPVRIVANSVRLIAREMLTDPMWSWWAEHSGLLVDRMREGFRPYGHRDFHAAMQGGQFVLIGDDVEYAWGNLNWLLAGGVSDILGGRRPAAKERQIGEAILRMLGVSPEEARDAVSVDLPPYPDLPIDFGFRETSLDRATESSAVDPMTPRRSNSGERLQN